MAVLAVVVVVVVVVVVWMELMLLPLFWLGVGRQRGCQMRSGASCAERSGTVAEPVNSAVGA